MRESGMQGAGNPYGFYQAGGEDPQQTGFVISLRAAIGETLMIKQVRR